MGDSKAAGVQGRANKHSEPIKVRSTESTPLQEAPSSLNLVVCRLAQVQTDFKACAHFMGRVKEA